MRTGFVSSAQGDFGQPDNRQLGFITLVSCKRPIPRPAKPRRNDRTDQKRGQRNVQRTRVSEEINSFHTTQENLSKLQERVNLSTCRRPGPFRPAGLF
jgi:hypothetical protein